MAKKKIAFITDSTAYLTEELRQHPDVYVVPIVIISNGEELEDGVQLTSEKLYNLIQTEKEVPKTSQPNVAKFSELYIRLKEQYESAIAIHVSSKLSGTISSSTTAISQVDFDVEVVDSNSLSYAITILLEKGLKLAEENTDYRKIATLLREEALLSRNLILVGSLQQLYKGGRLSGTSFLLGNLLQIKPILTIDSTGELGLLERIRSEKKAFKRIVELIKKTNEKSEIHQLGIMHGQALEKAKELKQKLMEELPNIKTQIGEISSSLAVHAGEGTLGVFWKQGKK